MVTTRFKTLMCVSFIIAQNHCQKNLQKFENFALRLVSIVAFKMTSHFLYTYFKAVVGKLFRQVTMFLQNQTNDQKPLGFEGYLRSQYKTQCWFMHNQKAHIQLRKQDTNVFLLQIS